MSPEQFALERARLRETYGDSQAEAGARFEQELARLFARSGWTQEELAEKEGKDRTWITRRLLLGRFLDYVPVGTIPDSLVKTLTEGRFRSYWERAESFGGNERQRFDEVIRLMADKRTLRPSVLPKILATYVDRKFHKAADIAKAVGTDEGHVILTLRNMPKRSTAKAHVEERKKGGHLSFCLSPLDDRSVRVAELREKLLPLIEALETEGKKKHNAVIAMAQVQYLAGKLRRQLEQWAK